jgi:hypothetical protein
MAKSRTQLSTDAVNTNLPDNTGKLITPVLHRTQLTEERDSAINIVDDGVLPNEVLGGKALEMTSPKSIVNLGVNDLITSNQMLGILQSNDVEPNYFEVTSSSYTLQDSDNGKLLFHDGLPTCDISIPLGSNVELFRVNNKATQNTSIITSGTLLDSEGNDLAGNYTINLENKAVFISKSDADEWTVYELGGGGGLSSQTVAFCVSSDAPVSKPVTFSDIITIDTASQHVSPLLIDGSTTYESSLDAVTYVSHANLTDLQTWINTNGSGIEYVIRAIGVYSASATGDATINFKYQ